MDKTDRVEPLSGRRSTVFVCTTCRRTGEAADPMEARSGSRLLKKLQDDLGPDADGLHLVAVECLSNCTQSATVAIAAPDKWTYVIGNLDPAEHAGDVLAFARLHQAHADGVPVWRERPQFVRKNTIARVPPLKTAID